jgi:hypothetical protein
VLQRDPLIVALTQNRLQVQSPRKQVVIVSALSEFAHPSRPLSCFIKLIVEVRKVCGTDQRSHSDTRRRKLLRQHRE